MTSGRRTEPLVQLEVRVAAARHREAVVEPADLLEERAGHEQAVALEDAVEPVALADEVADLEEAVAVERPLDAPEQRVLVGGVVPGDHGFGLLPGTDVPLLRRDDRRLVASQADHAELQHARREHVRAVDHEREGLAAAELDAAVQRDGR